MPSNTVDWSTGHCKIRQLGTAIDASKAPTSARWVQHKLRGAYALDLNISHAELGSLFHPHPGTAVWALLQQARNVFGCEFLSLGTNGTTGSNTAMIATAVSEGEEILVHRDAHSSVNGGLTVVGARPHYLPVRLDGEYGLPLGPTIKEVRAALAVHPRCTAVVFTAPNYFGRIPAVDELVSEVKHHGLLCCVDAAHGAHLRTSAKLPTPIEAAQPTMMTLSLHKTLGALGQSSILLGFSRDTALPARLAEVENALSLKSTSFSTISLLSAWVALEEMRNSAAWDLAVDLAYHLRRRLNQVPGCQVVPFTRVPGVLAQDPTRICVDVRDTGLSGYSFAQWLVSSPVQGVRHIAEMETQRHVLFIVTSAATQMAADQLVQAFQYIVREYGRNTRVLPDFVLPPEDLPTMELTPREAFMTRRRRRLPIAQAVGCVSAETIATYPPGAPIVVAGECLRKEDLDYLRAARHSGASLKGASDPQFETVQIIAS